MSITTSEVKETLEHAVRTIFPGSALGVDIGGSSAKIVQVRKEAHAVVLETYGEIELGPYGDLAKGDVPALGPEKRAMALLDLAAAVSAGAHRACLSIPLSSAFVSVITTPQRNAEQMRLIMPSEAKRYIPVPLENVALDWQILRTYDESRPFERAELKEAVQPGTQEVLLAAVRNEAIAESGSLAAFARISQPLYEVEMFAAARSASRRAGESTLFIDLGASATKIYALDEHGRATRAHGIESGGLAITRRIMEESSCHFPEAEAQKRESGLHASDAVGAIVRSELMRTFSEAKRVAQEYDAQHERTITRIILAGGGALMPGVADLAHGTLGLEVALASPFSRVQGPYILADVLASVGPLYSVATGLALRAIEN